MDDMLVLLNLQIVGRFHNIWDYTTFEADDILVEYLGVDPEDTHQQVAAKGLYMQLRWLRDLVYPAAVQE